MATPAPQNPTTEPKTTAQLRARLKQLRVVIPIHARKADLEKLLAEKEEQIRGISESEKVSEPSEESQKTLPGPLRVEKLDIRSTESSSAKEIKIPNIQKLL